MNLVTIVGNVGRDADERKTAKGLSVVNLSVATSSGRGEKKKTDWHKVVVFGIPDAATIRKGNRVIVCGNLQEREWTDKDGNKRYSVEIIANSIGFEMQRERIESQNAPNDGIDQRTPDGDGIPF